MAGLYRVSGFTALLLTSVICDANDMSYGRDAALIGTPSGVHQYVSPAHKTIGYDRPLLLASSDSGMYSSEISYLRHNTALDPYRLGSDGLSSLSYGFSRRWDISELHLLSMVSDRDRYMHGAVSFGQFTMALATGSGRGAFTADNSYRGIDPYFFHGGSNASFSFNGSSIAYSLSDDVLVHAGAMTMHAARLEDRRASHVGVSNDRFAATFTSLKRGREAMGSAVDLGLRVGTAQLNFQQLRAATGAYTKRLSFWSPLSARRAVQVNLASSDNPLYQNGENRVILSVMGVIGRTRGAALHAADEPEPVDSQTKAKKRNKVLIITGVAVAGAAAIGSSGSKSKDETPRFATQNAAGFDAVNAINPTSVRENREHGGWVYRNADGSYGRTPAVAGQVAQIDLVPAFEFVPEGTSLAASYHTHGGPDPRFDNENFSPQDVIADRSLGVDGYLGTPAGFLKWHQHRTGEIVTLSRVAN
ncbi:MAG: DUF4329 domain-containing protein [Gammaproteobacteria bacterium]|nr:DUF4329 domain-containing protein [Gammaproteobacteria bacterium]MDH3467087.1 DUF4329 domain-containing protein [Gammaproteobacteria bacterium]